MDGILGAVKLVAAEIDLGWENTGRAPIQVLPLQPLYDDLYATMVSSFLCRFWLCSVAVPHMSVDAYRFNHCFPSIAR